MPCSHHCHQNPAPQILPTVNLSRSIQNAYKLTPVFKKAKLRGTKSGLKSRIWRAQKLTPEAWMVQSHSMLNDECTLCIIFQFWVNSEFLCMSDLWFLPTILPLEYVLQCSLFRHMHDQNLSWNGRTYEPTKCHMTIWPTTSTQAWGTQFSTSEQVEQRQPPVNLILLGGVTWGWWGGREGPHGSLSGSVGQKKKKLYRVPKLDLQQSEGGKGGGRGREAVGAGLTIQPPVTTSSWPG